VLRPVPAAGLEAAIRGAGRHNRLLGIDLEQAGGLSAGCWREPDAAGLARDLIDQVGAWLGTDQRRVAASMVVLGYAARVLGPAVAVLARDAILVDLSPDRVTFDFTTDRGFQLALTPPAAGWRGPNPALLQRWHTDLIDGHLAPVIDAVRSVVPVAAGLLWGNVASGLTGALIALTRDDTIPVQQAHTTGQALLDHGPLQTGGDWTLDQHGVRFTRRSCCLYYRLPGGGMCADCALQPGTDPQPTTPDTR
jgi:ferric iron reductase protein FhuF